MRRTSATRARARALAQSIACEIHPLNNLRVLKYLVRELKVEEEAKNKVQAPAGEEVVAQTVDAATPAIVEAATAAQPELMAQAAPADSATTTDPNTQVVPTTVEGAVAEAKEETKEVEAASGTESEDTRPWYMKPSGMALIGVAALIGYKALASKE